MDLKKNIRIILKEMEAYRAHSLFVEAGKKCAELEALIRQSAKIKNKQKYLNVLAEKINSLKADARRFDEMGVAVKMSAREQELVKKLFSYSIEEGTDSAIWEGAVALLVFGQFQGALEEFNRLTDKTSFRIAAAKNIIRCHLGLGSIGDAVTQYRRWAADSAFSPAELERIRPFLQGLLDKKGIAETLPHPESAGDRPRREKQIDILSVVITTDRHPKKDFELDVTFQRKNVINAIVPAKHNVLLDYLQVGKTLEDVQFNSYDVIFFDACVITEKNEIRLGPKKGNYSLAIKILES